MTASEAKEITLQVLQEMLARIKAKPDVPVFAEGQKARVTDFYYERLTTLTGERKCCFCQVHRSYRNPCCTATCEVAVLCMRGSVATQLVRECDLEPVYPSTIATRLAWLIAKLEAVEVEA